MNAEFIPLLLEGLTGTSGALVLALVMLYAVWRVATLHAVPAVERWAKKQDERFETIMQSHDADRTVFRDTMSSMTTRIGSIERGVDTLGREVNDLKLHILRGDSE